jgi:hypothetical protein
LSNHRATAVMLSVAACLANGMANAAPAPEPRAGPSERQLAEAVQLGTVATLAVLCGLRDDGWAEDLRRAAVQSATGTDAQDDPGLKMAPGSNLAVGALSFAEAEALESFAEAPPESSCRPLAANPDLTRADDIVRAFRDRPAHLPGS